MIREQREKVRGEKDGRRKTNVAARDCREMGLKGRTPIPLSREPQTGDCADGFMGIYLFHQVAYIKYVQLFVCKSNIHT